MPTHTFVLSRTFDGADTGHSERATKVLFVKGVVLVSCERKRSTRFGKMRHSL